MKLPALLPLALSLTIGQASAHCSRAELIRFTDRYVAAQRNGSVTALTSLLGSAFSYTESEVPTPLNASILNTPLPSIASARSFHDATSCATFTELIVPDSSPSSGPYVIGTRMSFNQNHRATLIETLATKPGDWLFNATGYAYYNSLEDWSPIPSGRQDSREVIKAAGDAYFDRFSNTNTTVPFGTPCARLEGGAYTDTRNSSVNTCALGLPSTLAVTNRRYVVDEVLGAVVILVGFPGLDRTVEAQPMPDSHLFRVEGGRIRYIHTLSTCVTPGCGMMGGNGTVNIPTMAARRKLVNAGPWKYQWKREKRVGGGGEEKRKKAVRLTA